MRIAGGGMTGRTVSHYRVLGKLGGGGMGVVYRAEDLKLKRLVALKFLPEDWAKDRQAVQRFRREAQTASALNHPNICIIHDIDDVNGEQFIVMELLEGQTLKDKLNGRPLPLDQIVELGTQIADALHAAHAKGIVHRDVKPANIFITGRGQAKVLDFGLAKLAEYRPVFEETVPATATFSDEPLTSPGVAVGTAGYMSPEQVRGEEVDSRSDIFSLGGTLYEMATGREAFGGRTAGVIHEAILNRRPPPARDFNPALPPRLVEIIEKALEKDRDLRYQHAVDIRADLNRLKRDSESGGARTQAAPAADIEPRRFALRPVIAAGAGVLLVAALAIAWWAWQRPRSPASGSAESHYRLTRLTSDIGLTVTPAISHDGKLVAYASDRGGEGNLDIWVQQAAGGEAVRLTKDPADDYEPSFSPDGSLVAFRSDRRGGGVYTVQALGGDAKLVAKEGRRPRFSPDGTLLAYWVGHLSLVAGTTFVVPVVGGQPRIIGREGPYAGRDPVWSRDGRHLLMRYFPESGEEDWWVLPLDGGAPVQTGAYEALRKHGLSGYYGADTWLADGNHVVFSAQFGDSRNLWKIALSPGTFKAVGPPVRLTFGTEGEWQASFSAGGRAVFAGLSVTSNIWLLPLGSNRSKVTEARQITSHSRRLVEPDLSWDGRWLAYVDANAASANLWLYDLLMGKESGAVRTNERQVRPILTADGRTVFYAVTERMPSTSAGPFVIWAVSTEGGIPEKVLDESTMYYAFTSSGDRVAYRMRDTIYELDRKTGAKRVLLTQRSARIYDQRYSPDGRWLAFHETDGRSRKLLVANVMAAVEGKEAAKQEATAPSGNDCRAAWSSDGNTLYFLSGRDGSFCIWAQRLEPDTKRPHGEAIPIHHLHGASRRLSSTSGDVGLKVARDKIVFAVEESRGNVWMLEPAARSQR